MWNPKLITVCLLAALSFASCSKTVRIESKVFSRVKLKSDFRYEGRACKETIESQLAEVWTSGFLKDNELVRKEILNNEYGIFRKATEFTASKKGRAYFKMGKGNIDRIMLHRNLFCHFEHILGGEVILRPLDKKFRATLVHELFHDFWHNILDRRERFLFAMEVEIFYLELDMARTQEDKLMFLRDIGLKEPTENNFKAYEELRDYKEHYPDQKFYGTELYAILAEKTFSGKIIIPRQLKKFYYGIVSESMLQRNEL
jgi:hypothetical protein